VPPEYVKVKEGLWRVKSGWINPIWDWGRGRLIQKGADVVKGAATAMNAKQEKDIIRKRRTSSGRSSRLVTRRWRRRSRGAAAIGSRASGVGKTWRDGGLGSGARPHRRGVGASGPRGLGGAGRCCGERAAGADGRDAAGDGLR
jgi:hypothetical protein